jgi:uncharacterized protein involved in type VI secretion and phage assembly
MRKISGAMPGRVKDIDDPQGEGRVQVEFPWMEGNAEGYWAAVATPMAGHERGMWYRPLVGDEVLVVFDQGDMNHPYIVGYLWNGAEKPPTNDQQLRVIHSVNGHEIAIYDPDPLQGDMGYIRLSDAHGNVIELTNGSINIRSTGAIMLNAPQIVLNGRAVAPAPRPI